MKKSSTMFIKDFSGKRVAVKLQVTQYTNNGQIAILLYTPDGEYYADLSVFIEEFEDKTYMAVDTNNLPNAEQFIREYEIGELVGYTRSGFCEYPIYGMDLDMLMTYDEEGTWEFADALSEDEETSDPRTQI